MKTCQRWWCWCTREDHFYRLGWQFRMSWSGERIQKEGKITFSTIWSGGLFSLRQDRACWTLFYSWLNLSLFDVLFCFCFFYFILLYALSLSPTVNPETISAWSGELSSCMLCYLRNIPCRRNAAGSKWWSVTCRVGWKDIDCFDLLPYLKWNRVTSCNSAELHSLRLVVRQSVTG